MKITETDELARAVARELELADPTPEQAKAIVADADKEEDEDE